MRTIYIIGGTMGVGKTTVCQILKKKLTNCAFLDGDWCWDMDPFQVTEETKEMVTDNICHHLNSFLRCSAFENIVFCWVMHQQEIIDGILSRLNTEGWRVVKVSLVCSPGALTERLRKDVEGGLRTPDVIDRSIPRLPLYEKLDTPKIDVSSISAEEAALRIMSL